MNADRRSLSVIVPVYYNEQSLPLLFEQLREVEKELQQRGLGLELIFVDDGSGDRSFDELMKIKKERNETRVIKHTRNFGSMQALKTAYRFVTGDCFTALAADLQDPPALILEMVDKWLQGAKYVICTRVSRDDPVTSKIAARIYYRLLRYLVIREYPSGGFDLALTDKSLLPFLQKSGKNINPLLFTYWLGYKPQVLEYHRRKRAHGRSRWTFSKKLKFFLDSLLGFSIVPIRLISGVGVMVALVSFTYTIVVVVSAALGGSKVPGFPTTVSLLSFLLGLIIIMLGVIGEYLWRIFDQISNRPESVVDEVY